MAHNPDENLELKRRTEWVADWIERGLSRVCTVTVEASGPSPATEVGHFDGIERMLQQLCEMTREGALSRVQWKRWGNTFVILVDHNPCCDWILPAVQMRLRAELVELYAGRQPDSIQFIDLTRHERLDVFGFQLQLKLSDDGNGRVHATPVQTRAATSN